MTGATNTGVDKLCDSDSVFVLTEVNEGLDDVKVLGLKIMPDRESVGGPGTAGSGGFLPLQFPSAFAAFHATTPPGGAPTAAMHHATHYHHHAQ